MINVGLAGWRSVQSGKNFNVKIFLHTITLMNVKLCIVVLLIEPYLFISPTVTLTIYQGHSSFKQFETERQDSFDILIKS